MAEKRTKKRIPDEVPDVSEFIISAPNIWTKPSRPSDSEDVERGTS
jgi:hypothetical protein